MVSIFNQETTACHNRYYYWCSDKNGTLKNDLQARKWPRKPLMQTILLRRLASAVATKSRKFCDTSNVVKRGFLQVVHQSVLIRISSSSINLITVYTFGIGNSYPESIELATLDIRQLDWIMLVSVMPNSFLYLGNRRNTHQMKHPKPPLLIFFIQ